MKAGSKGFLSSRIMLVGSFLLVMMSSIVQADTSVETCANDSLFLLSPDALLFEMQYEGRNGMVISWEDMDLEEATCFALTGHEDLDCEVSVDGGFGDQVDRQILFSALETIVVGSSAPGAAHLQWVTEGSSTNGTLAGTINVSNNGGVFHYDESDSEWEQVNTGIPMVWQQTNVVAMDGGSNGFLVAAFSSGQTIGSNPVGLYVCMEDEWRAIGEEIFTSSKNVTQISVSPANNDHFVVGTENDGLYVTTDGGVSFTQWAANLDSAFDPAPDSVLISALEWGGGRIWAFAPNFGLFYSEDSGLSFDRSDLLVDVDLDHPEDGVALPVMVNEIRVNPSLPDHIMIAMSFNGVFQSIDAGDNWTDTYGDLMVVDPENSGAWMRTATNVMVDPEDSSVLIVGLKGRGLYRTANGGINWVLVGEDVRPESLSDLVKYSFIISDGPGGEFYCQVDNWSVLVSSDAGLTWNHLADQPLLSLGLDLCLKGDGSGDFYMSSWGGGIFVPGTPLGLSDTYNTLTSSYLRNMDIGIDITIGTEINPGTIHSGEEFRLKCQTFQGWAVWRGPGHDPENMALIGVFDRVNPEACIEGYCGNNNWQIIPQCYNSKRAACFDFSTPDTVRFFDEEIYNGFGYNYAVTSFDYGNTALVSAENSSVAPVYSPRWDEDTLSPFDGEGNRSYILLNVEPTSDVSDEGIYVYPNPLRLDAGLPGQEGETVVFTNLPEGARVRIFTTAGDDVINLGADNMQGGNIFWRSRNRDGESVSAGVYLYLVETPHREDFWGKLIIIR